jgi:hypothetical protein
MQLLAMAMARWVGPADQHGVALLANEVTHGEVTHERRAMRKSW